MSTRRFTATACVFKSRLTTNVTMSLIKLLRLYPTLAFFVRPKKNKPLAQISSDVSLHFERQAAVAAQHIDQSLFQ